MFTSSDQSFLVPNLFCIFIFYFLEPKSLKGAGCKTRLGSRISNENIQSPCNVCLIYDWFYQVVVCCRTSQRRARGTGRQRTKAAHAHSAAWASYFTIILSLFIVMLVPR